MYIITDNKFWAKMMIHTLRLVFLLLFAGAQMVLYGQPAERLIKVLVTPNHVDWLYQPGENVKFKVSVLKCNVPQLDMQIRYTISEDMMNPHLKGECTLRKGSAEIEAGTMKKEGFLRCIVHVDYQGRDYEGIATVGFSPEKLRPTTQLPDDFLEYWNKVKLDARKWPLEPMMTLVPERCTDKVNVYHVSFASNDYASRIYGMLCVPKSPGKYPAILKVPGAGVRAYKGEVDRASKGVIILEIGIHGIPVNLSDEVYHRLYNGPLKRYHSFNMENRDKYYYKRVYAGCVRAVDFIYTLPEFNGHVATFGGSQGGALSIVTAALDERICGLVSYYPALCDIVGYVHGRAGGWPHSFKDKENWTPEKIRTMSYYDVVNFARQIKVPGFYTCGYNDMVCPPTSTFSAFNMIKARKEMFIAETTAHYAYIEQSSAAWNWIMEFLKAQSSVSR